MTLQFFSSSIHKITHSEEKLVILGRGRECSAGLSILLVYGQGGIPVHPLLQAPGSAAHGGETLVYSGHVPAVGRALHVQVVIEPRQLLQLTAQARQPLLQLPADCACVQETSRINKIKTIEPDNFFSR